MTNKMLFITSICFGYINIYLSNSNEKIIILLGTITSILNHYYSNKYIKWIDRIYITSVLIRNVIFIEDMILFQIGNICGAITYILSKIFKKTYLHVLAHFFVTLSYYVYFTLNV